MDRSFRGFKQEQRSESGILSVFILHASRVALCASVFDATPLSQQGATQDFDRHVTRCVVCKSI